MKKSDLALYGGKPVALMQPRISSIGTEELDAAHRVVESGVLSGFRGGSEVRAFEAAFAAYVGTKYAIATSSGTTALHTSIAALGLSEEDEVIVPAVTFVSTASVVLQEHAKVLFADITDDYCIDVDDVARKITPRTKAIIPVHLYGRPADMDGLRKLAQRHGITIIEDACQAHGAIYGGKKTGSIGDVGCFSFFETKNMTTGEGGMITTSDDTLYQALRLRREHGSPENSGTWYAYRVLGYNYNMTEVQGAIGQAQLCKLDAMNAGRAANAALYDEALAGLGLALPPPIGEDATNVYHNYPVLLPSRHAARRDLFVKAMAAEGIPIDVAYPCVLYETELFRQAGISGDCPRAVAITSRIFTLFTDRAITAEVIRHTAEAARKVLAYLDSLDD